MMVTTTTTANIAAAAADTATATASDADEAKSSPLEPPLSSNGDDGNSNNCNEMMHPSSPPPLSSLFKNNNIIISNDAPTNHNDRTADAAMEVPSAVPVNDTIGGGTNDDATGIADKNIIHSNSTTSLEQPVSLSSLSKSSTRQAVSLPSANHQQQLSIHSQQLLRQHQPLVDENKIQKAISFLHNPTIRDVSNNSKRTYLQEKTDLNMEEIDAAMRRMRRMEFSEGANGGGVDDNVGDGIIYGGDDSTTPGNNERNDHQQRHQWQGKQLQHPGDHYTQQKQLRQGNPPSHREYDNYNTARRIYPPSPSKPSFPQLQDDNEYNNHWQRTRGYYDDPHYRNNRSNYPDNNQPHHREWEGDGGEAYALAAAGRGGGTSSWVGGFSLGILGLAAWRWLNGGDFVLFPPPNIIMSATSTTTATTPTTTIKSTAVSKKEEEEIMKTVSWKDLPSSPEEVEEQEEDGYEDEDQEEEEDVDDEEDEDNDLEYDDEVELAASHDLHSLLNHNNSNKTSRSRYHSHSTNSSFQHHQPQMQHPSYNELVLEIRALTSAIHSHRDSQERINRNAYNTNVGKGMTDDAMDFLRKKKEENSIIVDVAKQENLSTVALLLKEVSDDLIKIKQSMILEPREDGNEESIVKAGAAEENSKNEDCEKELVVEGPTNHIDMVIKKVHKMLTLVDEKPIKILGNNSTIVNGTIDCNKDAVMREGEDEVTNATSILSALVAPTESVPSEEGTDAVKAREPEAQELKVHDEDDLDLHPTPETFQQSHEQQHQQKLLEDALRTLATSNDAQKLKVGAQMLYLYCRNISQNASVPRYRKIYTNNNTYRNKVGNLVGARDFLIAVGFIEHAKENVFEWSDPVGGRDTEGTIKTKLDFAMVALELMKNGSEVDANGGDYKDAK